MGSSRSSSSHSSGKGKEPEREEKKGGKVPSIFWDGLALLTAGKEDAARLESKLREDYYGPSSSSRNSHKSSSSSSGSSSHGSKSGSRSGSSHSRHSSSSRHSGKSHHSSHSGRSHHSSSHASRSRHGTIPEEDEGINPMMSGATLVGQEREEKSLPKIPHRGHWSDDRVFRTPSAVYIDPANVPLPPSHSGSSDVSKSSRYVIVVEKTGAVKIPHHHHHRQTSEAKNTKMRKLTLNEAAVQGEGPRGFSSWAQAGPPRNGMYTRGEPLETYMRRYHEDQQWHDEQQEDAERQRIDGYRPDQLQQQPYGYLGEDDNEVPIPDVSGRYGDGISSRTVVPEDSITSIVERGHHRRHRSRRH